MAENTKHCGTCKYGYLGPGYEPCKSCGDDCSNWEGQDGVIPVPEEYNTRKAIEKMLGIEKKLYNVTVVLRERDPLTGSQFIIFETAVNAGYKDSEVFTVTGVNGEYLFIPKDRVQYIKAIPVKED